jgi:hypothetical protein
LKAIHPRYRQASRAEKRRILDEFCQVTRYHRKSALRLLNGPPPARKPRAPRRRPPTYGIRVIQVLAAIWRAAGCPWSVRLKALLPLWLPRARAHFRLTPALEAQLLRLSPRQMDRRLAVYRRPAGTGRFGRTKPGTLLKHHIPLRTDRWDVTVPGFTEIDLVAHGGDAGDGEFAHSLNVTDIHTTWVETRAVMGRGQHAVQQALEEIRQTLPFLLQGIDSDNGSEFINAHLVRYCRAHRIQFTRGRPYQKDDNAHIEQKNWTHVRKLLGYVRYDSPAAVAALNALYRQDLRLWQNLFLPSVKLVRKVRVGSRIRRVYDRPQTPFERVQAVRRPISRVAQPASSRPSSTLCCRDDRGELARLYALAHHRAAPRSPAPPIPTERPPASHRHPERPAPSASPQTAAPRSGVARVRVPQPGRVTSQMARRSGGK